MSICLVYTSSSIYKTFSSTLLRWPITMAQQWPDCTVVGLDIAPIQTDLAALARAQALVGVQQAEDGKMAVDWEDLSKRVAWKIGNL